jgi:hypothetical protein
LKGQILGIKYENKEFSVSKRGTVDTTQKEFFGQIKRKCRGQKRLKN